MRINGVDYCDECHLTFGSAEPRVAFPKVLLHTQCLEKWAIKQDEQAQREAFGRVLRKHEQTHAQQVH